MVLAHSSRILFFLVSFNMVRTMEYNIDTTKISKGYQIRATVFGKEKSARWSANGNKINDASNRLDALKGDIDTNNGATNNSGDLNKRRGSHGEWRYAQGRI